MKRFAVCCTAAVLSIWMLLAGTMAAEPVQEPEVLLPGQDGSYTVEYVQDAIHSGEVYTLAVVQGKYEQADGVRITAENVLYLNETQAEEGKMCKS